MNIWAISDTHLSFGTPNKSMDRFGPAWTNHASRLEAAWDSAVAPSDIVLIAGDISWAKTFEEALPDLQWLESRPGTKILIKGNHDYWWESAAKMIPKLPSSIHIIHNSCWTRGSLAICGSRLWETNQYSCTDLFETYTEDVRIDQSEALFNKEVLRLQMSLQNIPNYATTRIVMTHFPPIGSNLAPSPVSELLEKYQIQYAVFGHLHGLNPALSSVFGQKNGIQYILSSCDWVHCTPLWLMST